MKRPSLQTLPVGSLVFSVLAEDKDSGSAGAVVYYIERVSAKCGPHCSSWPPGGSISHTTCRGLEGWGGPQLCSGPALVLKPSEGPNLDRRSVPSADSTLHPTLLPRGTV